MERKIAGYYRLSVEDEAGDESNSITNQRLLIQRYLLEQPDLAGAEYCEFYDDGVSGMTMERPGMQELLKEIKADKIKCVVVKDLSRFSRDYMELGAWLEQIFPFMGVRFIAITEHYDSLDTIGKTPDIAVGFQSLLADFYCRDVSEKVRSAVMAKKNQGKYATGNTPFGYRKSEADRNVLIPVPEEAAVVRRIFALSLEGKNLTQICRMLNDEGVPTPLEYKNLRKRQKRKELDQEHKYWQPATVRTILTNKSYLGHMVCCKSVREQAGEKRVRLKPRQEWKEFENHHPAIVGKDAFDAVQKKFMRKRTTPEASVSCALKGKVYCGYCRRRLGLRKLADGQLVFDCPNRRLSSHNRCIRRSVGNALLEKIILAEIRTELKGAVDFAAVRRDVTAELKKSMEGKKREILHVEKELSRLGERKAGLLETYHAGTLTAEQYMEHRSRLEMQISGKQARRKEFQKQLEDCRKYIDDATGGGKAVFSCTGIPALTKELADALLERVEIGDDRTMDIYWRFGRESSG